MNWNAILGVACTVSLFLPVAAILYHKLYRHRSLAALCIYYAVTAFYSLMAGGYLPVSAPYVRAFGVLNNYLDVPLMLTALLFFCPNKQKQKPVHLFTALFVVYEICIAFISGFTPKSVVYIMGPGIALVLIYSFYLFTRHIKMAVVHGKNAGRTLMLAAILFAYSCYSIVYYFFYVQQTPNVADAFLIYFMASIVSCVMMTIGLHLVRKRIRALEEVQNTRRELALFFGEAI